MTILSGESYSSFLLFQLAKVQDTKNLWKIELKDTYFDGKVFEIHANIFFFHAKIFFFCHLVHFPQIFLKTFHIMPAL